MEFSTILLPREMDQVLMKIFFAEVQSLETIRSLGKCRGALEAIFLSDVTTAVGRYLKKMSSTQKARISNFPTNIPQTRIGTHGSTSGTTLH
jgi:hypothetical protein